MTIKNANIMNSDRESESDGGSSMDDDRSESTSESIVDNDCIDDDRHEDNSLMDDDDDDDDDLPLEYVYEYHSDDDFSNKTSMEGSGNDDDEQKRRKQKQQTRMDKIEKAASNIRNVIEKYGNAPLPSLDPPPTSNASNGGGEEWRIEKDSPWADTSLAIKEIVSAREEMKRVWDEDGDSDDNENDIDSKEGDFDEKATEENATKKEWWKRPNDSNNNAMNLQDWYHKFNEAEQNRKQKQKEQTLTTEEEETFQQIHMEWVTNAFAEELDALRKGQLEQQSSGGKSKKKGVEESSSALDLDPTHHSFIIAKSQTKNSSGKQELDGMDKEEADAEMAAAAAAEIDVHVLADTIQSGGQFLSMTERRMLMNARLRGENHAGQGGGGARVAGRAKDKGLTLHERRQQELGFVKK